MIILLFSFLSFAQISSTVKSVSVSNFPSSQAVTGTFWQNTQPISGSVSVSNFPASQAVTGTFFQATQPVSIASMPSTPVTGTFWQATQPVSLASAISANATLSAETTKVIGTVNVAAAQTIGVTGTFFQATQPVSAAALPLPTGASTSALQSTGNTSIASIDTKTPALGQALAASSVPVVLTAAQLTTLTPVSTVTANIGTSGSLNLEATQSAMSAKLPASLGQKAAAASMAVVLPSDGGNPCQNPMATLVSITGATSGTSAVQIIALSGSTKIYICSMNIIGVSGTTPTFSLVQGTGSNCVTGQTVLQQSWTTAAGTLYNFAGPSVAVSVAGNAVCYLDTGTTPIQKYTIAYIQQ